MEQQLLNFANLVLSFAFGWAAVCRLHVMTGRVRIRYAVVYVCMFALSVLDGLQFFFFGRFAGVPELALTATLCALLWCDLPAWRNGPPSYAMRA
jgi:hypothetical protein